MNTFVEFYVMFVNWYNLHEDKNKDYQTEFSKISMKIIKQNTPKQFKKQNKFQIHEHYK